jgi:hypothetical protein
VLATQCPFRNVMVAVMHYRSMISGEYRSAQQSLNSLRWLFLIDSQDILKRLVISLGSKKNLSCRHVIYSVRNVIEKFVSNGSTVNVCALDLSKAFDRMNHYALLIKLMDRQIPIQLLIILETWFYVSITCVKWDKEVSYFFILIAGVRQGGVLSPFLFAIFIDDIVDKVKLANVGCFISSICCSIFLYADDILIISPTVTGLQILLNVCEAELSDLDMSINVNKSLCIRFGRKFDAPCAELATANGGSIKWVAECRYLGVYFVSGHLFRCSFSDAKCRFFRAFNSIFSKVGRFASHEVVICLLRTKCIPILLYAVEACPLLVRHKQSMEFSITRIFMKLFCTGSPELVKECQRYFNFLPIGSQIALRTANFLQQFVLTENDLCLLFAREAALDLQETFSHFGENIDNIFDLRQAAYNCT